MLDMMDEREKIESIVKSLNTQPVREMHSKDFTPEQVISAIGRYRRGVTPHTPLEAAIKNIMDELDRQTS